MRRATTDHQAPDGMGLTTFAAESPSRSRKSSKATPASRTKKRRLCYQLMVLVVVFQVGILTSNRESGRNVGVNPSSSSSSLRGQAPAGTFNQYPIYQSSAPFHSTVHCVGETHNPETAWMYRSCEFTNLCLDTQTRDFHIVQSTSQQELQEHRVPLSYISTELLSSDASTNLTLALGGINPRWLGKDYNQGIEKVKWFPKVVSQAPAQYYVLDPTVTLLPFHSFAAHNVGHLLWDDFLPMYTLLSIFGRADLVSRQSLPISPDKLLLLRVDTLPLLYGTCEMRRKKGKKCADNFEKFLPLLGVDPRTFTTLKTTIFQPLESNGPTWICARNAMAGLGMLTDHGLKDHGWFMPKETHAVQNTAKGALLYQFRNAMVQNLGLPLKLPQRNAALRIVMSAHSSGDPTRDVDFFNQENALKRALPTVSIHHAELSKMTMREQVELVVQTHIFVSTCGGGSMTATFLPRGATLILYYDEQGGYDFANNFNITGDPAFLDWDLMNNMSYLRVHWLPIGTMNTPAGLETLVRLIQHDLEVMTSGV